MLSYVAQDRILAICSDKATCVRCIKTTIVRVEGTPICTYCIAELTRPFTAKQ